MNNLFNRIEKAQSREDNRNYNESRQAAAFEHFAGEFADTGVSYQNVGGFVLPLQIIPHLIAYNQ